MKTARRSRQFCRETGKPMPRWSNATPIQWVRSGHTVGFVPIHPNDAKNHPPLNRSEAVFAVNDKGDRRIAPAEPVGARQFQVLNQPPRGFREPAERPLARVEAPRMTAQQLRAVAGARDASSRVAGVPITFDHKSQSFLMQQQAMRSGRSVTVMAPINNRTGNLQSHSVGFGGGPGMHGGAVAGGAMHSGGNGGGGASHAGGSSGSSSSNSSSAASAPASSSSSAAAPTHH